MPERIHPPKARLDFALLALVPFLAACGDQSTTWQDVAMWGVVLFGIAAIEAAGRINRGRKRGGDE